MAILKVARLGHPVLRSPSRELTKKEILSDEIQSLIVDLIDTMEEYDGIGLAAPQVHKNVQVCVVHVSPNNSRYDVKDDLPLHVICNPKITPIGEETEQMWEGCLSVPGMRGLVRRPKKIRLQALDAQGNPIDWELDGLPAVVVQHETDHLFGILYVDKLVDPKQFAFNEEYQRYWQPEKKHEELPD